MPSLQMTGTEDNDHQQWTTKYISQC